MKPIYYYDGKLFSEEEAAIPFSDRSLFFGDAVYDACLIRSGIPYLLDAHLDRFYNGMRALSIPSPMDREHLRATLSALSLRAGEETAFLYFQAARRAARRRHYFEEKDGAGLMICVYPFAKPQRDSVLRLILAKDTRYEYCHIKTVNLLPAVLASARARAQGADEAVFVRDGLVTECAHSNISILKDGVLLTHPTDRHILAGIARARLLDTCTALGIPVAERPFGVRELLSADEILVTSTSKIAARANEVAGRRVGMRNGTLAKRILDSLFDAYYNI